MTVRYYSLFFGLIQILKNIEIITFSVHTEIFLFDRSSPFYQIRSHIFYCINNCEFNPSSILAASMSVVQYYGRKLYRNLQYTDLVYYRS